MKNICTERRLHGTGTFAFTDGDNLPIGNFRIEQTISGRTFLYCERTLPLIFKARFGSLAGFEGQTTAGQPIVTHGGLSEYTETPKEICFVVRTVEVGRVMPDGHTHELSLTNLRFPSENPRLIAFVVPWGDAKVSIRLVPRRNYQERIEQLTKFRGVVLAQREHEERI